MKLLTHLMLAR